MVAAITYPEWVQKFVMGGSHIGTGGDRYLMANRPSEGSRATRQALDDPSRENITHYLRVHIDDESLVTDELVDYIHRAHTWSQEFIEARRQSASLPHDYTQDSPASRRPSSDPRAIRPDGGLRGQHRDPEPHCRRAPRASQQLRVLAAVREAGRVGRAGPRVPAGLLSGWPGSKPILLSSPACYPCFIRPFIRYLSSSLRHRRTSWWRG